MMRAGIIVLASVVFAFAAGGEKRPIDTGNSHLTVHVGKTGSFAGLGHEHVITAPIVRGDVENSKSLAVQLDVNATAMKVVDPGISDKDRGDVQKAMLGPEVLDVARFPEIRFVSGQVEVLSESQWRIHGSLTLHGQTKPIVLETTLKNGHYRGTATVLQTNFGITPIKAAGGTIKVKDEVQIEYDITLAGQ